MYQCRHCHREVVYVGYVVPMEEYGRYYIEDDEYHDEDRTETGDRTYECPHCGQESDSFGNLCALVSEEESARVPEAPRRSPHELEEAADPRQTTVVMGGFVMTCHTHIAICSRCRRPYAPGVACTCSEKKRR